MMRTMMYLVLVSLGMPTWLGAVPPPEPYGATPSARQLQWHEMEFYGFIHFSINTFTDKEWGDGSERPSRFNPTAFDADQIAGTAKMAGMKGLILTCKHHDGFCLWPSEFTEHSVKNSPWREGQGDMVREFADACKKHGLKFGVYLSPWDRNHAEYGRPAYVEYFRKQLRELLTNYGPIAEVWFDGANGGTGYYGGANERRNIDRKTYYGWDKTIQLVRELQPDACIFSDAGPDVRWVGNERGIAGDPCWATYNVGDAVPGVANKADLNKGNRGGTHWIPAEADVSIRKGWFYHRSQDGSVRSPKNLLNLFYQSVGRGASLLLNLPPDRRGLIHENDVESLREFRRILDETFSVDLAHRELTTTSSVRGGAMEYAGDKATDGNPQTYWAPEEDATAPSMVIELGGEKVFNVVSLREYLPLGQRVDGWALDRWEGEAWIEFARGTAIGSRRLWRGNDMFTRRVRLRIVAAAASPAILEFALHREPELAGTVRGAPARMDLGLSKKGWNIHSASYASPGGGAAARAIDGNSKTLWHTHGAEGEQPPPQEIVVDMGREVEIAGFLYLPRSDGNTKGMVDQFAFYAGHDPENWGPAVAEGEFANIKANPMQQKVSLEQPVKARYFRFVALHSVDGRHVTAAEIGIVAK